MTESNKPESLSESEFKKTANPKKLAIEFPELSPDAQHLLARVRNVSQHAQGVINSLATNPQDSLTQNARHTRTLMDGIEVLEAQIMDRKEPLANIEKGIKFMEEEFGARTPPAPQKLIPQ